MSASPRLRILIVDDDEIVLEILKDWLQSAGHVVTTRHGALGTSALVLRDKPDVAILDVNMPGLAGDAIARLIQNGTAEFKPTVMLVTADNSPTVGQLAEKCGAIGVLQKTPDAGAFMRKFDALYARRAAD